MKNESSTMNQFLLDPATTNALALINAIKQSNDAELNKLLRSVTDPEFASTTVRANCTYAVEKIAGTSNVKRACMWAAPLVVRGSMASLLACGSDQLDLKSDLLTSTLKRAMHPSGEMRYMAKLLSYETVSALSPTQTYVACKALAGMPQGTKFNFPVRSESHPESVPRLAFIVGTAAAVNTAPELVKLSGSHREKVRSILSGLVTPKKIPAGTHESFAPDVTAVEPLLFEGAMERGMHMWLDVMGMDHVFHAVNLKPLKGHKYRFQLYLQRADEDVESITWTMSTTQFKESFIASIYQRIDAICAMPLHMRNQRARKLH